MIDLIEVLRADGFDVRNDVAPLEPHPRIFHPIGVGLHHTASPADAGPNPSLGYVRRRRLCNVLVGRDGGVHVITNGLSFHFGEGHPAVLARLRSGLAAEVYNGKPLVPVDGNPLFYGVEVENDGRGEPWSDLVKATSAGVCASILRAKGWDANRLVLHKEWAPWRKIDPSWGDGPTWRSMTTAQLVVAATLPSEEDVKLEFAKRDNEDPRTYLVIGRRFKIRMLDWDQLMNQAVQLGIDPRPVDLPPQEINDMRTLLDDPA